MNLVQSDYDESRGVSISRNEAAVEAVADAMRF